MRGLSARLLILTVFFVMLSEVLIFAPSIGRFRQVWIEERLNAAHLASMALEATPDAMLDAALTQRLLGLAGARAIEVRKKSGARLMLGEPMPWHYSTACDMRDEGFFELIGEAFETLAHRENRVVKVTGTSQRDDHPVVVVLLDEAPLRTDMLAYSWRILALSLFISVVTAALVFASLQWLAVWPLRRLTASITAFREQPDDPDRVMIPGGRTDEVGSAEQALAAMQQDIRAALLQRARLAAVGSAVTKIQHDLKAMLSSAMLVSDTLEASGDPEIRRITPALLNSIDRAVALCTQTLSYVRDGQPIAQPRPVLLAPLVAEVGSRLVSAGAAGSGGVLENHLAPDLTVHADPMQLARVIENLVRNAFEAGAHKVSVTSVRERERVSVEIADDGPGLPQRAQDNLFRPFAGSAKLGGSGLGLAIAHELAQAQGGRITLIRTGAGGTIFRLDLPAQALVS
jgi:signal transduction histidine kinase